MSIESAKSFIKRIVSDDEFGQKVQNCYSAFARIEYAKTVGYDFTPTEAHSAMVSLLNSGALSQSEMNILASRMR